MTNTDISRLGRARLDLKACPRCGPGTATDESPTPYLHVLHMDGGQKTKRLTFSDKHPFGRPGRDYSVAFEVTSVRLKPEMHAQDERAMDIVRRAAAMIDESAMVDKALLAYVFDTDNGCDGMHARIVDLCYTAFMAAKAPNTEDGGPSDWFTDTKPNIDKCIARMKTRLLTDE